MISSVAGSSFFPGPTLGSPFDSVLKVNPARRRRGQGGSGGSDLAPQQQGQAVTPSAKVQDWWALLSLYSSHFIKIIKHFIKLE